MKTSKAFFYLFTLLFFNSVSIYPQEVRPVRDDVGFCWQGNQFDNFVKWLDENCEQEKFEYENLVAAISPHDDYLYAGEIYYPLYKLINTKEVVIFGVTHGAVRKEIDDPKNVLILDEFDKWKGPYGDVSISPLRETIKRELDSQYFIISNQAHRFEHSIEALIPFLQHYNREIKITPIMITAMSFERMDSLSAKLTEIVSTYVKGNSLKFGKDIFFLISNDANHYGEDFNNLPYGLDEEAHRIATDNDKRIASETFNGAITQDKIKNFSNELLPEAGVNQNCPLWCGRYPIVFGLLTINKIANETGMNINGKVFKYSDTWTGGVLPFKGIEMGITAPYSLKHWVGFLSAGFYLE
jgi:AmmeMemoRadiSam system protein B